MSNTSRRRRSARVVAHCTIHVDLSSYADAVFGFDRRHMSEAALSMRDEMSREEEPSFVIKDPIYVKVDKQYFLVAYLQWQMVGGVGEIAMSLVFGQLICIPTMLASS